MRDDKTRTGQFSLILRTHFDIYLRPVSTLLSLAPIQIQTDVTMSRAHLRHDSAPH